MPRQPVTAYANPSSLVVKADRKNRTQPKTRERRVFWDSHSPDKVIFLGCKEDDEVTDIFGRLPNLSDIRKLGSDNVILELVEEYE